VEWLRLREYGRKEIDQETCEEEEWLEVVRKVEAVVPSRQRLGYSAPAAGRLRSAMKLPGTNPARSGHTGRFIRITVGARGSGVHDVKRAL
jgi:hypothetical protein